jgi:NhaP-type Na+/H+ or K+/H+ antiporter
VLFVVRPVTPGSGWPGRRRPRRRARAIAFFGIRGIGSLYYLAYAVEHAEFPNVDRLWALVAFTSSSRSSSTARPRPS